MEAFWTLPPVTRTLTAATVGLSLAAYGGLIPFHPIIFHTSFIFRLPPQVWRLVTSFLLTGPKLSMILDPYFLYIHGSQLETNSPRFSQPGDFFTYVVFVWIVILAVGGFILGGLGFLSGLIIAFIYTNAQDDPNRSVSFFIMTFEQKYLPYAMLLLDVIMGGPTAALIPGTGLIAAHLYDFLTRIWPTLGGGTNYITTPSFVKRWFGADSPAPRARGYGTAFPGRQDQAQGSSSGRSTGFSIGDWRTRGPGRRLGGD